VSKQSYRIVDWSEFSFLCSFLTTNW
jgi:hypothetical protein